MSTNPERLAELRRILAEDPNLQSVTDADEFRRELASLEALSGFDAMGAPVTSIRRDRAYQWLRCVNVERSEAWSTVEAVAHHLERDHPHEAMERAQKTVDLTGAYRLLAILLTG